MTAGCLLVLSTATFCHGGRNNLKDRGINALTLLVLVATGIGLMEILQPWSGIDLENWLLPETETLGAIPIGRMSPITAIVVIVAGLGSFLLLQMRHSRHAQGLGNWASSLGIVTALVGATLLLAYLYGTPLMYGGADVPVAATTALSFILIGIALIAASGPHSFPIRLIIGDSTSARLLRFFLPFVVVPILVQSALSQLLVTSFRGYETIFLAVLVIVVVMVTTSLVVRIAHPLGRDLDEANQQLLESEERFRARQDASIGGIAIHEQGIIIDCNQRLAELSGYSTTELIGMNGLDLFAPECREQVIEKMRKGVEQPYDAEGILKDGTRRQFSVCGKNIPYRGRTVRVTEVSDITERKLAEARLVESEARLQTLIHAIPDLIWLKNHGGVFLACNQRFESFVGKFEKEIVNKTDYDFVDKELADFFREHDRMAMAKGSPSINEEWITFASDGHRELLETTKTPIFDAAGRVIGVLGIGHDITERKRLESEMSARVDELNKLNKRLEEAQNQLMQSEKMSAVGQLAAGVAHEINNPIGFVSSNLGSLSGYVNDMLRLIEAYQLFADTCQSEHPAVLRVDALRREMDIDFMLEDVKSLLSESEEGLDRIKRIVADLKDFSRVGESEWQFADVHKCMDSTLNVIANEIKYKAKVVKEYGTLPAVRCMPFQLNQVFMNLIVNGSQAIKDHGTITLRTGCDAATVWIEIEDDGEGIPPENVARIFDPFFTTKPVGSGTGLGLSVSYGIVQKHHGRINVCSDPGNGTVFRVTLPIDPQLVNEETAAAATPEARNPAKASL